MRHDERMRFVRGSWGASCLAMAAIVSGCGSDAPDVVGGGGAAGDRLSEYAVNPEFDTKSNVALSSDAQSCSADGKCPSGFCVDGVCCNAACSDTCVACTAMKKGGGIDGECGPIAFYGDPDEECSAGSCDGVGNCKLYNGNRCATAADCLSGYCVDGYCCGAACTEPCSACSAAKKGDGPNGQCGFIVVGTDPDGECPFGVCSGSGLCSGSVSSVWASWPMPNPSRAGLPNPSNYVVDEANAIVTDNVTGLMWQRRVSPYSYTWANAVAYCDKLVLGRYNDWRVPSRIELVSLVDFSTKLPSIDESAFPETPGVVFWTHSRWSVASSNIWTVSFNQGDVATNAATNSYRVRCVR